MTYTINEMFTVKVVHRILGYNEDRFHQFTTLKKAKAFIKKANLDDFNKQLLAVWVNDKESKVLRVEKDIIKTTKISIFNQEVVK